MIFEKTGIPGAYLIRPEPHADERGSFARTWCVQEFGAEGITFEPSQSSMARSRSRGTLRGLHYQVAPHEECKLLWCGGGVVFDVIADVRPDSPTYGRWAGFKLTSEAGEMIFVPEGVAHGYLTLVDDTRVVYLTSGGYHPSSERGIRWDDPTFGIDWPLADGLIVSEKDRGWEDFELQQE